ncbi:hypothetical protein PPSIR1_39185, partial [Plesiocystis pacifica SIR-1]
MDLGAHALAGAELALVEPAEGFGVGLGGR